MAGSPDFRRYLIDMDTPSMPQLFTDCLIIGAGIAGLRAAIEAAENCSVIIVCKQTLEDSNTWKAQGGIASVLKKTDSFKAHIDDTLTAGCGINNNEVVELVVKNGPDLIKQLLEWGTEFDMLQGSIATTFEGGHTNPRVAHAHGDETGRQIAKTLIEKVRRHPNIKIIENFYTLDLITNDDNACIGAIGQQSRTGPQIIWAANTILATGGAGQLYRETTNPAVATADGIAMAYRASAVLTDLEFMQFHPTTLYVAGASRALITEALRGEGTILLDCNGSRFMPDYDEAAELAPRDIVSRAILYQMLKTNSTHVFLDVRHFDKKHFNERFPTISSICESFDIDTATQLIPVRPSAHYMIGGVKTDINAKTTINNLYACGEIAATGLHGANRLGSNSLLEGLVFGKIAGKNVCQIKGNSSLSLKHPKIKYDIPHSDRSRLDAEDVTNSLKALMWRNVGITRKEKPLTEAAEIITFWQRYVMDKVFDSPPAWQCQNMLTVALLMAQAAQQRKESRGVHYRQDHPDLDDDKFKKHLEFTHS